MCGDITWLSNDDGINSNEQIQNVGLDVFQDGCQKRHICFLYSDTITEQHLEC